MTTSITTGFPNQEEYTGDKYFIPSGIMMVSLLSLGIDITGRAQYLYRGDNRKSVQIGTDPYPSDFRRPFRHYHPALMGRWVLGRSEDLGCLVRLEDCLAALYDRSGYLVPSER